ncbi:MAG: nitronate monooxygenase [Actinomycetota bacterium]|nr:nitronate monooxygenase [Actinomycetota bacterium]
MVIDELVFPVVLAPLAGGPSTPALAAAVSEAGGLGFLASGYLSAMALRERLDEARQLTGAPLGVNVFCPGPGPSPPSRYADYLARLDQWARSAGVQLGEPRYSDDEWDGKLDLLTEAPVPVVSFTFGCPDTATAKRLQTAGSEVWVTVTSPEEAQLAQAAGADVLVVQGAEAGGHRGSFSDEGDIAVYALLPLLAMVSAASSLPVVASGAIATAEGVAAVLSAGAVAAQAGTAFMLSPEAGTAPAHRAALRSPARTQLTRAFTGRLARGIQNGFIAEHETHAPAAYPELHYVTAPMRARAREQGNPDLINLWAGQAHQLAEELPAAEIVRRLGLKAVDRNRRCSPGSR